MATPFLQSGVSFQDGNTYPASSLTNAVNNAVLLKTVITQWANKTSPVGADQVLLYDSVADALKSATISSLQGTAAIFYGGTDTGSANTYVVNASPTPTSYYTPSAYIFLAANANTGASTFNANGLGAIDIQYNGSALLANQILAGGYYVLGYNGSKFELLNPSPTAIANSQLATMAAGTIKANSGTSTSVPSDVTCTASGFSFMAATSAAAQRSLLSVLATTDANFKIGSFTRDISLASGTQSITGVGFTPRVVIFLANISSQFQVSIGFDNATSHMCLDSVSANVWGTDTLHSIYMYIDGSNFCLGTISSMDADGFTVTWAKTGSPTGTATILYLAIR